LIFKNKLLLNIIVITLIFISSGIVYEQFSRVSTLQKYKPKGSLVDIGLRMLHLDCRGSGPPIVILESGLDTLGSSSWCVVQDRLAKLTRTCGYDRVGIMWSHPRPYKSNLMEAIANDLNKALVLTDEKPSYILVSHSFGGPYITKFTELYGDKVAGIVFVDSPHPEQMDLVREIEMPLISSITNKASQVLSHFMNIMGLTRLINMQDKRRFQNQPDYNSDMIKALAPLSGDTLSHEISNYSKGLQ
jgi:pimeloyl-ACP methyl ester carboxylesterase